MSRFYSLNRVELHELTDREILESVRIVSEDSIPLSYVGKTVYDKRGSFYRVVEVQKTWTELKTLDDISVEGVKERIKGGAKVHRVESLSHLVEDGIDTEIGDIVISQKSEKFNVVVSGGENKPGYVYEFVDNSDKTYPVEVG